MNLMTKNSLISDKEKDLIFFRSLPEEITNRMASNQVEQNNRKDLKVFERHLGAGRSQGGFTWRGTVEGQFFWQDILRRRNISTYYERYPEDKKLLIHIL